MKIYLKANENLSKPITQRQLGYLGSDYHKGFDGFVSLCRNFYKETTKDLFLMMVRQVWIESMFTYEGHRRKGRGKNGISQDWAYSKFLKAVVGHSAKALTTGMVFYAVPTYFKDYFPDFLINDPFENPELYPYPYKHITLDFLYFVQNHHERLEMLQYAEDKKMTIEEFESWSYNQAMCYNEEKGKDIYSLKRNSFIPYLASSIKKKR